MAKTYTFIAQMRAAAVGGGSALLVWSAPTDR